MTTPDAPEGGGEPTNEAWKESTDAAIKDQADGVYQFPVEDAKVSGTDLAIGGTKDDNWVFKFTSEAEDVTFSMWKQDGTLTQKETMTFTAGAHFFYYQLTGSSMGNAGSPANTTDLSGQSCRWQIVGSVSGVIDQGTLNIPA